MLSIIGNAIWEWNRAVLFRIGYSILFIFSRFFFFLFLILPIRVSFRSSYTNITLATIKIIKHIGRVSAYDELPSPWCIAAGRSSVTEISFRLAWDTFRQTFPNDTSDPSTKIGGYYSRRHSKLISNINAKY